MCCCATSIVQCYALQKNTCFIIRHKSIPLKIGSGETFAPCYLGWWVPFQGACLEQPNIDFVLTSLTIMWVGWQKNMPSKGPKF